ncbi:MAG: dienelactone hydrolase family protein [Actinomycetota bacterium]
MCYETTARPPLPPICGGAATGEQITLTAADGNEFAAFSAQAESPGGPGIVVLPDVRGLHAFYEDLALRFAGAGVHATAFDYFGRTAGLPDGGRRDDEFDFWPEVMKTSAETVALDVTAAMERLRSKEGGAATAIYTVGFCFGGRHSFNQSAQQDGLAGVIGFYGRVSPTNEEDTDAPVDLAKDYKAPVLGHFGGTDQLIPAAGIEEFGRALDAAGVSNDLKIYEGAPHSFFDRAFAQFSAECDDAWTRMLEFVRAAA